MKQLTRTDAEWRVLLTAEQYRVTRRGGTEAPFSGPYHDNRTPGTYRCVCCDTPLFRTGDQYDAGTGWPSFRAAAFPEHLGIVRGTAYLIRRTQVRCLRCGAHLGYVFRDGPPPWGVRYSINSAALTFEPAADLPLFAQERHPPTAATPALWDGPLSAQQPR